MKKYITAAVALGLIFVATWLLQSSFSRVEEERIEQQSAASMIDASLLSTEGLETAAHRAERYKTLTEKLTQLFPSIAECPNMDDPFFEWSAMFEVHHLTGGRLLSVTCFMGAYQGSSIWFALGAEENGSVPVKLLSFETRTAQGERNQTLMPVGAYYDDTTGKIMVFDRGRAIGDCGTFAQYAFDESTQTLVLERFQLKADCDGQLIPPAEWEVLYQR